MPELPPRTRRIQLTPVIPVDSLGTTSAYAENTSGRRLRTRLTRNYLRVRGEYGFHRFHPIRIVELPPRTRRIQIIIRRHKLPWGTTSAYAENTPDTFASRNIPGNYLRVRGEYGPFTGSTCTNTELPPRTRRIRCLLVTGGDTHGTTSAYAENTLNELGLL